MSGSRVLSCEFIHASDRSEDCFALLETFTPTPLSDFCNKGYISLSRLVLSTQWVALQHLSRQSFIYFFVYLIALDKLRLRKLPE